VTDIDKNTSLLCCGINFGCKKLYDEKVSYQPCSRQGWKLTDSDKHTSLLHCGINFSHKKLYDERASSPALLKTWLEVTDSDKHTSLLHEELILAAKVFFAFLRHGLDCKAAILNCSIWGPQKPTPQKYAESFYRIKC
jgi:hypothetical protein